jgi:hypothetical protein
LLAGSGVLGVEYARAPEQVESRFHNVIYLNEKTVGSDGVFERAWWQSFSKP